MAQRLRGPCAAPGCPNRATAHGYCDAHQHLVRQTRREAWQQADSQRGSAAERGYGGAWQKARLAWLKAHPLCEECLRQGRTTPATVVDHIIPHKGDKHLFWDSANNWASLCTACHNAKTARGE